MGQMTYVGQLTIHRVLPVRNRVRPSTQGTAMATDHSPPEDAVAPTTTQEDRA